jgi:glycosyltransferase involved in cell wall biosynthesis
MGRTVTAENQEQRAGRRKIAVRQFTRRPVPGWFSIERIFEDIRDELPDDLDVQLVVNRRPSKGIVPRLLDALVARGLRGDVNHILGDVHYLAWFMPKARTIITIHDCVSLERLTGARRRLFWLLWYWWPMKRVAAVVVVSDFSRKSLLKWVRYPDSRISIIPPPVSREFQFHEPRPHDRWSRVLHIGSTPNKNLGRVIEALAGLDVTLVTIGRLNLEQQSSILAHGLRHENYVDLSRDELAEQYRSADILLFPSTYEGFGMPIIEAQSVGRPVITSDLSPMRDVSGGAACLVDPFAPSSIRSGLLRLLRDADYAEALIAAGRDNAERYRAPTIAANYAALYRSLGGKQDG